MCYNCFCFDMRYCYIAYRVSSWCICFEKRNCVSIKIVAVSFHKNRNCLFVKRCFTHTINVTYLFCDATVINCVTACSHWQKKVCTYFGTSLRRLLLHSYGLQCHRRWRMMNRSNRMSKIRRGCTVFPRTLVFLAVNHRKPQRLRGAQLKALEKFDWTFSFTFWRKCNRCVRY